MNCYNKEQIETTRTVQLWRLVCEIYYPCKTKFHKVTEFCRQSTAETQDMGPHRDYQYILNVLWNSFNIPNSKHLAATVARNYYKQCRWCGEFLGINDQTHLLMFCNMKQ